MAPEQPERTRSDEVSGKVISSRHYATHREDLGLFKIPDSRFRIRVITKEFPDLFNSVDYVGCHAAIEQHGLALRRVLIDQCSYCLRLNSWT